MRFLHTLLALVCSISFLNAQITNWTGAVDQNWSNPANWDNGIPTTGGIAKLLPGTPSPVVASGISIDFEVQNFITIRLEGTVMNSGHFINFNVGTVENRSNFTNNGSIQFDNGGRFDNHQQFTNNGNITQTGSGTWYNHPLSEMIIGSTGTFQNFGYFENNGTLTNNGFFSTASQVVNNGVLNSNQTFLVGSAGLLKNNLSGFVNVGTGGAFDVQGTLDNLGNVINRSAFKVSAGGTFLNKFIFTNFSVARNFGTTINSGSYNVGLIGFDTAGIYQYNDYGGTFRNQKTLSNLGTLELMPCSEFYQESVVGAPVTGRVWLMGIVYEIQGLIDQSMIMGGIVLHGQDQPRPTALCKTANLTLDGTGHISLDALLVDNGSRADYCEITNRSVSPYQFSCANVGVNNVVLTVTDSKGRSNTCSTTVRINASAACPGCFNITHPGSISGNQTICSGDIPAPIQNVQLATGGVGVAEYVWIYWTVDPATAPNAFTMIAGSNVATLQPGALTTTTWFRRCARTATCQDFIAETNFIKVTVEQKPNATLQITEPTCSNPTGSVVLNGWTLDVLVGLDGATPTAGQGAISGIAPGNHTLTLKRGNCSNTLNFSIENQPTQAPQPQFTVTQATCQVPSGGVSISNLPAGFQVKLDNGAFTNQTVFAGLTAGQHTITFGNGGCSSAANFQIDPFIAPLPNVVCKNITVQLVNGVATITAAEIDNGSTGGSCSTISGYTLGQTTFQSAGVFTVTLTVTNSFGQTSSCTAQVRVTEPPYACPGGLAVGGDFEGALTGWWKNGAGAVSSTSPNSGLKSYEICGAEGGAGFNFPVAAGDVVTFSAYAKISGNPDCAGVKLEFFNSNWQKLSEEWVNVTSTEYQRYLITLTAPAGAVFAQPLFWKCANGCLFVDDVCVLRAALLCPTPTFTVAQPGLCETTGSVTLTNLPDGWETRLDNGAWILGKSTYTGIAPGNHKIAFQFGSCCKDAPFTINAGQTTPIPQFSTVQPNCTSPTGSITITNLPQGFSSKLDNGAWTVDKTNYTNIAAGQHTISIGKDGCNASATFTLNVASTTPTPTLTISQPACGQTTGSINITNLPSGYSSSLDGGAWTLGKTSYTGVSIGSHTISIGKNGCNASATFSISATSGGLTFDPTKCYRIINKVSGRAITVSGGSTADGANIVQWDYIQNAEQIWNFVPADNGFYYLTNKKTGKVIDIEGASQTQHAYALQWTKHGGANQQFSFESIGSGYYIIKARHSCQVLKLSSSPGSNGTRLFQAVYSSTYEHAKWKIEEVSCDGSAPQPQPDNCNKTALLVVGTQNGCNSTTLNNGDTWVKNRLQQLGLTVTVKTDSEVQASHAAGKGVVVISSTSLSGNIGTRLTNVAVPLTTWEPMLLDELKMIGSSSNAGATTSSQGFINNTGHSITAGLPTGWQTIFSNCSTGMNWGIPMTAAQKLVVNNSGSLVFIYEAGAAMNGINAPARRAGLFLNDWSSTCLNSTGRQIFDHTIEWLVGCSLTNLSAAVQLPSLSFSAYKSGFESKLSWISNTGERNDYFVIERSADGTNFQPIQKVDATGAADEIQYFNELDKTPLAGDNFYRLRLIYLDGREVESEIQMLNFPAPQRLAIFPNPAANETWIDLKDFAGKTVELTLVNQMGKPVQTIQIENTPTTPVRLDLKNLENGFYAVNILSEGVKKTAKLIVNKE